METPPIYKSDYLSMARGCFRDAASQRISASMLKIGANLLLSKAELAIRINDMHSVDPNEFPKLSAERLSNVRLQINKAQLDFEQAARLKQEAFKNTVYGTGLYVAGVAQKMVSKLG